jgi:hypothetical protein
MTDHDLERFLRLRHESVSSCRNRLVQLGLVVDSGKRAGGRIVWQLPPAPEPGSEPTPPRLNLRQLEQRLDGADLRVRWVNSGTWIATLTTKRPKAVRMGHGDTLSAAVCCALRKAGKL